MALTPGASRELVDSAPRFGHEIVAFAHDAFDIVRLLDVHSPDAVLASADPAIVNAGVVAQCDARGIRVLALVETDAHRRTARDCGLHETIAAGEGWPHVESLGQDVLDVVQPSRAHVEGTVIAVWGPVGSPGRTTIATSMAVELAAAGFSVAIADADPHGASVAPVLGLLDEAPGFAAACRLAATESIGHEQLERVAQRYSVGVVGMWVLTGIAQPHRWPELSSARVEGTLAACRSWVDFTIVDVGFSLESDEEISSDIFAPRRNAATLAAIGCADHIVAVGAGDPVGVSRFLRAHAELVELTHPKPISVVINKIRASAIGVDPGGQVRRSLARFAGITEATLVPFDQSASDAAILAARALSHASPKSPATSAIRSFVRTRFVPARERMRGKRSPLSRAVQRFSRAAVAR